LELVRVLHQLQLLLFIRQLVLIVILLIEQVEVVRHPLDLLVGFLLKLLHLVLVVLLLLFERLDVLDFLLVLLLELVRLLDDAAESFKVHWIVNGGYLGHQIKVVHQKFLLLIDERHRDLQPRLPLGQVLQALL